MAASREDILGWFKRGQEQGATHVIVVCDTFDHKDYPVFVKSGEDVRECAKKYDQQNMQRIMEVYNLSMDIATQMAEHRAFHY